MKKSLILIASLILTGCFAQKRMTPNDWMRQAEQTEDSKVTALAQDTAPTSDNLIYEVDDPSGSPSSKKVTIEDLFDVEDVIGVKSFEDEDWGMASISTNSMTVEDFALNTDADAGDISADLTVKTIAGTIEDAASNAMVNFAPVTNLAANKNIVIDTALADQPPYSFAGGPGSTPIKEAAPRNGATNRGA